MAPGLFEDLFVWFLAGVCLAIGFMWGYAFGSRPRPDDKPPPPTDPWEEV